MKMRSNDEKCFIPVSLPKLALTFKTSIVNKNLKAENVLTSSVVTN